MKHIIGGILMTIALSADAQTDVVQKGFETGPDTVYGVLVGVLIAFGLGATGFFVWVFRKLFGWVEKYREEKNTLEGQKAEVQSEILNELKASREVQTKILQAQVSQGRDIAEIKDDLDVVKNDVEGVKKEVHALKERVEKGL